MKKNERKTKAIILIGMLILTAFFSVGNAATNTLKELKEIDDTDPYCEPYSLVDSDCYECEPYPGEIIVEKTVWNGEFWVESTAVLIGETVHFKAEVHNPNSYDVGFSGVIYDQLPYNLRYVNGSSTIPAQIEIVDWENNRVEWRRIPPIPPGETLTFTYNATAVECGAGFNNITAEALILVHDKKIPVTDSDEAKVDVICEQPELEVIIEKFVWNGEVWTDYAEFNLEDNINFKVIIYNPNECYLMHFSGIVFDQLPYNIRYVNGSSTIYPEGYGHPDLKLELVDWGNNTVIWRRPPSIMPNENLTFYYNATAVECGIGDNNVTAHPEGFDPVDCPVDPVSNADGAFDVSDQVTVNVICPPPVPDISVEKYVKFNCNGKYQKEIEAEIEDYVTFKLFVNNTGETVLDIVVRDTLPYGLSYALGYAMPAEPDEIVGNTLYWYFNGVEPGQSIVIVFRAIVDECGELVNNVDVTGIYEQQELVDDDSATVIVECPPENPDVDVEKQVKIDYEDESVDYLEVEISDVIIFEITVENTGDVVLDIDVIDFMPGGLEYYYNAMVDGIPTEPIFIDDYFIWQLENVEPGEIIVITYEALAGVCGQFENLVEVTGFYEETTVYDDDTATVMVYATPEIHLEKQADINVAEVGDTITYTYDVTNTGDVTLTSITVVDDLLGEVTLGKTTLEPSESTTGTLSYIVTENDLPGPIYNVATATGYPPCECEGEPVTDEDDETVEIIYNMEIDITKYVREDGCGEYNDEGVTIELGEFVTFKIVVENTGDVDLDVTLTDSLPEGLVFIDESMMIDGISAVPIWIDDYTFSVDLGILNPGDIVIITFEAEIEECGTYVNTADVTGSYSQITVSDQDDASVIVPCEPLFNKKVKDPETGEWIEQITTYVEHTVKFRLIFEYYGNEELPYVEIVDELPCIFTFDEGDFESNMDTSVDYEVDGDDKTITFTLDETLSEGETWWIEFEVLVTGETGDCPTCNAAINKAWLYGYNSEEQLLYEYCDEAKVISKENRPPCPPVLSGDTSGKEGDELTFKVKLVDLDGDDVYYTVDFGDGIVGIFLDPVSSGTTVTVKHTYADNGTYSVKARAKDIYNNVGEYGNILTVEITEKETTPDIEINFARMFYFGKITANIENTGTEDFSDLLWNITIKSSGFLKRINSLTNGTIESLESENNTNIVSEKIKGFGRIQITTTVKTEDVVLANKTINGFIIGRLIILL